MNNDTGEIKNRLNIVDVIGEYLRLEKAGANFRALCPFHNEKSPSFMVNEEKQIWHCFGCQKGGDIFTFVMEMEGLEFREALKLLAERAGVELSGFDPEASKDKDRTLEILDLASHFFEAQLWGNEGKKRVLGYLEKRGFGEKLIKDFRLGYAPPGWRHLLEFLVGRGYKPEDIEKAGLVIKKDNQGNDIKNYYDRFRDRITFPISNVQGKIVGFSARVSPGGDESQAKYINTPTTSVYDKSRVLYGIDKAKAHIKKEDFSLLVEGNADVIACHGAGLPMAVAVSGTALTEEQIKILSRYSQNIRMFFDADSAGQEAALKSVKACLSHEVNVFLVSSQGEKDAAEIAQNDPEKLKQIVEEAVPALDYFLDQMFARHDSSTSQGKKNIVEVFLDIIKNISNEIEKKHWLRELAQKLEIEENVLTDQLKRINLKDRIQKTSGENDQEQMEYKSRLECLLADLSGFCLAFPEIWKLAVRDEKISQLAKEERILEEIISSGEKVQFDTNRFVNLLPEENRGRVQKLFFDKKYYLGLDNKWEEVTLESPAKKLKEILKFIKQEEKKEELKKISQDLELARKNNDKSGEKILIQEFQKIVEELSSLK